MQHAIEIGRVATGNNIFTREIASFTKYVGPRGELNPEIRDNLTVQVGSCLTRNTSGFLNPRIPERAAVSKLQNKTSETSRLLGLMNMAEQLGAINMDNVDEEEFNRNCKILGTIYAYSRTLTQKLGNSKYNQHIFASPKAVYDFFSYSELVDGIVTYCEEYFRKTLVNDDSKLAQILVGMLDSPLSQPVKDEALGRNMEIMNVVLENGEQIPFVSEALDTFSERDIFRLATYFNIPR